MQGAEMFQRAIKAQANAAAARVLKAKVGYVTSYDPDTYAVRVRIEPESAANEARGLKAIETNWLPVLRMYGGNGWGMICPPNASPTKPYGDQCLVLWPDDGHGIALIGFFNDKERPLLGPEPGEMWIAHKDGAFIKLLNDGSVYVHGADGHEVRLQPDGAVQLEGQGGAIVHVKSSSPAGIGTVGAANSGVVTKQDLQFVLDQINIQLAARQAGASSNPLIQAVASTSVEVTD